MTLNEGRSSAPQENGYDLSTGVAFSVTFTCLANDLYFALKNPE
jgi:hypothetical protein